jgi:hypothetical protein
MDNKHWFLMTFAVLAVVTIIMSFTQAFRTLKTAPTYTSAPTTEDAVVSTENTASTSSATTSGVLGSSDSIEIVMAVLAIVLLGVGSYFGFTGHLNENWTTVILVSGCLMQGILLLRARDINAKLNSTLNAEFNWTILILMVQVCFAVMGVRG